MSIVTFGLLRALTFPFSLLSYRQIHRVGRWLGKGAYFCLPRFRKKALANLALATTLTLSQKEIIRLAKASFCNLMITCLEYAKLAREKKIARVASCTNPEVADSLMKEGKGVIFFCGHQANWEILFLEGTSRMPGVAIGRPVKNVLLYNWVLKMRQKFGGKIIAPKNAFREGLRALKHGSFLGIVGDQGMPDSGFSSPFFGRRAWTSPLPAILSYRTGRPIFVATTRREKGKYRIHYSDPIWPDENQPMEKEIPRLMEKCLTLFEESVKERPEEWLWQHNRWKQQTPEKLKRRFRHESLAIILPEEKEKFDLVVKDLSLFREIYPHEFITLFVPKAFETSPLLEDAEKIIYASEKEILIPDFRFKLIFNFTPYKSIHRHFRALGAFETADLKPDFAKQLKEMVCRV